MVEFVHNRLAARAALSRGPKPGHATLLGWKNQQWQRASDEMVSGKPGAIHNLGLIAAGALAHFRLAFELVAMQGQLIHDFNESCEQALRCIGIVPIRRQALDEDDLLLYAILCVLHMALRLCELNTE